MNIHAAFQQGDAVLIGVFALLIAMSVTSWYVIFQKSLKLAQERRAITAFESQRHTSGAVALLAAEAERLKSSLPSDWAERKETASLYLAQTLDKSRVHLERGLTLLASIGTSAPFIGLFGTVWGIYGALTSIAAEGNASLNVVAGPMGEALVATAAGLFAAIPAVLAYNAFVRANRVLVQDLRHIAERLTLQLSSQPQSHSEKIKLAHGGR